MALRDLSELRSLVVETPAQLARPTLRDAIAERLVIQRWTQSGGVTHPTLTFIGLHYANGNVGLGHVESDWSKGGAGPWHRVRSVLVRPQNLYT